jgi:hypothetical protein
MGRLQIPHGFHFLLDGFGGSKLLLSLTLCLSKGEEHDSLLNPELGKRPLKAIF